MTLLSKEGEGSFGVSDRKWHWGWSYIRYLVRNAKGSAALPEFASGLDPGGHRPSSSNSLPGVFVLCIDSRNSRTLVSCSEYAHEKGSNLKPTAHSRPETTFPALSLLVFDFLGVVFEFLSLVFDILTHKLAI